ncbi:hypothetical protein Tco_0755107 [Tanacetum coccineum]
MGRKHQVYTSKEDFYWVLTIRLWVSKGLGPPLVDDDLDEEEAIKVTEKKNLESDIMDETLDIDEIVNIKESRNHPVGIKRLLDDLRVTAAKLMLLVQKLLLLVLKVNAAGMNVTTAKRLQLLEEFMLTEKRSKTYQRKNKD